MLRHQESVGGDYVLGVSRQSLVTAAFALPGVSAFSQNNTELLFESGHGCLRHDSSQAQLY